MSGEQPLKKCPKCHVPLTDVSIDLEGSGSSFALLKCATCVGVMIPAGGMARVIAALKDGDIEALSRRIAPVLTGADDHSLSHSEYPSCPECRAPMNRRNLGARSGVILNECKKDGVWLNRGALDRIVDWARNGGIKRSLLMAEERKRSAALRQLEERQETDSERLRESERRSTAEALWDWLND